MGPSSGGNEAYNIDLFKNDQVGGKQADFDQEEDSEMKPAVRQESAESGSNGSSGTSNSDSGSSEDDDESDGDSDMAEEEEKRDHIEVPASVIQRFFNNQ